MISAADLIIKYEGFRATPYLCPAGVPTIGYGTTVYPDGCKVTLKDKPCTPELAFSWVQTSANRIWEQLKITKATLNQKAAITSWAYNVGISAALKSTLLKAFKAGDIVSAADEFLRWDKVNGKPAPGLTKRRIAEREVFLK